MRSIPFLSPLTVTPSGLAYFEPPKPGHLRHVKQVNVTALNLGNGGQLELQSSRIRGSVWAAGGGQNQALGLGGYPLIQTLDWFDTDSLSMSAVAGTGQVVQDQSLGTARGSSGVLWTLNLNYSQPVAAGELVVAWAIQTNNVGFPATLTDTKGNVFNKIVSQTNGIPGCALYCCLLANSVTNADSLQWTQQGAVALGAMSFTGVTASSYGAAGQFGTSLNPTASTTRPVNSGDLVVAVTISNTNTTVNTLSPGWNPLPADTADATVSGWLSPVTASEVTYQGTLSVSGSWSTVIAAFATATAGMPSASVTLTGDESY